MTKRKYNVILKYGDYTIISYEKKYMGTEYVIARKNGSDDSKATAICTVDQAGELGEIFRNFNAEEFSWDSASNNYVYSMESALATLLSRLGSDYVKSQRQLEAERIKKATIHWKGTIMI